MYFNPVTGAPAAMPQIQLPQSQTAAIPVDGGFTVGDALKKKRIAEALRAKVSQDYEQQAPTGHAAANGNFPGETYINYGNILQNAMQPWLEGRREKKAAAAEDESTAARLQALKSITGESTPEQLLQAGEGLDMPELSKRALAKILPDSMNAAARAQASGTKAGLLALLQLKEITQEEYEAGVAAIDAEAEAKRQAGRDEFLWKEQNTYRAPVAGKTPSTEDRAIQALMDSTPGMTYDQAYLQIKQGTKSPTKAAGAKDVTSADTQASLESANRLYDIFSDSATYSGWNKAGDYLVDVGNVGKDSDSMLAAGAGGVLTGIGQSLRNSRSLELQTARVSEMLGQAKQLYPVSNSDMQILASRIPSNWNDQEEVMKWVTQYRDLARKAHANRLLIEQGKIDPAQFDYKGDADFGDAALPPTTSAASAPAPAADDGAWTVKPKGAN